MNIKKVELTNWSSIVPRLLVLLCLLGLALSLIVDFDFKFQSTFNLVVVVCIGLLLISDINSFYRVFFDDEGIYLQKYFHHRNALIKIEYENLLAIIDRRGKPRSFSDLEYRDSQGKIKTAKLKISSGGWINFSKQLKKRGLLEKIPTRHTI
jgi:hypothetical protein